MAAFNGGPLFNYLGSELGNMIQNININQINNPISNKNIKYHKNIDETNIYLCLEIPGFLKEDCNINLNGGFLIFMGKTNYQHSNADNDNNIDFDFIQNKEFVTKIDLSDYNIDENNIKASFYNGLLKIKLKKKPKTNITIE
jgi:HSP20 family molecular chaperone IbpA